MGAATCTTLLSRMRTSLTCSHIASRVASRKISLRLSFSMQWSRSKLGICAHTWSSGGSLLQRQRAGEDVRGEKRKQKGTDFLTKAQLALGL